MVLNEELKEMINTLAASETRSFSSICRQALHEFFHKRAEATDLSASVVSQ
jgi:predicted transcriptional regulator